MATGRRRNIYKILNPYDGYDGRAGGCEVEGRLVIGGRVGAALQVQRQHLRIHQARFDTARESKCQIFKGNL